MTAVAQAGATRDRPDEDSHGAGRRRPAAARARVGQAGRAADPVHPRLVAEPSLLGQAVRERAGRRVPARGLRPARPRHVRGAARARALHRRRALGRRRGGDHRPAAPRPAGARRLVLRRLRHLRLRARVRPGSDRRDQLRRRRRQAGRGGVRHADRPRLPRPLRGRHGRRPADQHPGHARPSSGPSPAKPLPADDVETLLCSEHRRAGADPRQPRGPRDRLRRRAARSRGAAAGHATAGRTRSCCRRWPSTSSPPARPPRRPGTTASVTCRTWRSPSASTASWPS